MEDYFAPVTSLKLTSSFFDISIERVMTAMFAAFY